MNYLSKKQIANMDGLMTIQVEPKLAEFWLTLNSPNRDVSKRAVDEYARRMRNGAWIHNGESIKFNTDGMMIDGQHRLHAVIKSGTTITTDVRFGLGIEAKDAMDEGTKRSADGAFKMNDIPHYTNAAAICRGVMSWQRGSKIKAVLLSNHEVVEFYKKNPLAAKVAMLSSTPYLGVHKTISRSEIGVLMFLFAEIHGIESAAQFFDDLSSGHSIRTTCVRLLMDRLISDKLSNTKKMPAEVKRALIIKTWNNWIKRTNLKQLKYSAGEEFPKIL